MRFDRFLLTSLSLMIFFTLHPALVRGQGTGAQISGVANDVSGASIPGAKVIIVSKDTGARREVTTNQTGAFVAYELEPGHYLITVAAAGFRQPPQTM